MVNFDVPTVTFSPKTIRNRQGEDSDGNGSEYAETHRALTGEFWAKTDRGDVLEFRVNWSTRLKTIEENALSITRQRR